jgi:ubiquinone/menaquinone biosynthesis C-methylase UbiE
MNIKQLRKHWDTFGETDPLWAVITRPDKTGNQWELDEFFRTGEADIVWVMKHIASLGINLRGSRALDFGCGVGRLTQALAKHFEEVCGVDIAPSMIGLAKDYNRQGEKCKFYVNDRADLRLFDDATFDFIYSIITLQHMEAQYAKAYLKEFLRLLVQQGVLVFQIPSEQVRSEPESEGTRAKEDKTLFARIKLFTKSVVLQTIFDFYRRLKYPKPFPRMEMHGVKREEVLKFLEQNRAQILDVVQDDKPGSSWVSYTYFVVKK